MLRIVTENDEDRARQLAGLDEDSHELPIEDEEAADVVCNRRRWAQEDRASVKEGIMYLMHPMPTNEEWAAF
ncbi:hypothetical protein [Methylorubrum sp. POS3]|uniref:hypothetical protein n=1 Tax=Methylorubrum sp. POS3 TaxID=2998492 RepID=UPI003726FE8F